MAVDSIEDLRTLVRRATAGDPDAWETLFRRSYPRLFTYARRRLASDQAADDAVSETMLRALDKIHTFTWQGAGFDAWLSGIVRNVVHESHRSAGRDRPLPEDRPVADPGPGPLDRVIATEQHEHLRIAFARLSADEQEVLELRVVQGLGAEGVAEVLGSRAGAVRMAQSRALGRLRTFLSEVSGGA